MNVYDEHEKDSGQFSIIMPPPAKSVFMPTGDDYLQFHIPQEVPNWFWRTMQYLFFGFKWRAKRKDEL